LAQQYLEKDELTYRQTVRPGHIQITYQTAETAEQATTDSTVDSATVDSATIDSNTADSATIDSAAVD
jgi:hypothetical protein